MTSPRAAAACCRARWRSKRDVVLRTGRGWSRPAKARESTSPCSTSRTRHTRRRRPPATVLEVYSTTGRAHRSLESLGTVWQLLPVAGTVLVLATRGTGERAKSTPRSATARAVAVPQSVEDVHRWRTSFYPLLAEWKSDCCYPPSRSKPRSTRCHPTYRCLTFCSATKVFVFFISMTFSRTL